MVENKQPSGPKSKQDYAEHQQKPITLKKNIGGLVRPGKRKVRPAAAAATSSPTPPQRKKVTVKKKAAATAEQLALQGISKAAREAAVNAAREEGLTLNEWLERAIVQAVSTTPVDREPAQAVQDALAEIRSSLVRIEHQCGFLYRIWQRVKLLFLKPA